MIFELNVILLAWSFHTENEHGGGGAEGEGAGVQVLQETQRKTTQVSPKLWKRHVWRSQLHYQPALSQFFLSELPSTMCVSKQRCSLQTWEWWRGKIVKRHIPRPCSEGCWMWSRDLERRQLISSLHPPLQPTPALLPEEFRLSGHEHDQISSYPIIRVHLTSARCPSYIVPSAGPPALAKIGSSHQPQRRFQKLAGWLYKGFTLHWRCLQCLQAFQLLEVVCAPLLGNSPPCCNFLLSLCSWQPAHHLQADSELALLISMVWISLDQELLATVLHFLSYPDPSARGSQNLWPPRKVGLTSLSPINKVSWIGPCDWQLTTFTLEIIAPSTAFPKGLGQTFIISYHTSIICIYLYVGCELSDAQDYSLLIAAWVWGLLILRETVTEHLLPGRPCARCFQAICHLILTTALQEQHFHEFHMNKWASEAKEFR